MTKEIWKPYKSSPYMVSNRGRIRRGKRILKERLNPGGYSYANLSYDGKKEEPAVHAMVLEAFNVPRPKGIKNPIIKHKNNKKNDNRLSNLEWGSISNNTKEAYDDGLIKGKGVNNNKKIKSKRKSYSKEFKYDKTGDQDKQDSNEYKEGPIIPEGWNEKKSYYDEDGAEEKPVNEVPEGWHIQK